MESIETVCDNLVKAFSDQQDDPVSLVTIIDMYIEQVDLDGTRKEKETFLGTLLDQLKTHPKTVGEIGWDLPKELLRFFSKRSVNSNTRLTDEKVVVLVMSCFNEIALAGNPKECLLIGCQLLSELSISELSETLDDEDDDENITPTATTSDTVTSADIPKDSDYIGRTVIERDPVQFFFGLQSYALFELIQTVIRRISTLYPSKFLGMAVSAILKYLKSNIDEIEDVNIVLRRVYTFCRVYSPSDVPQDIKEEGKLTKSELEKIEEDELALQRKLLRSLCTFGIGYGLKTVSFRLDIKYYAALTGIPFQFPTFYEKTFEIAVRYYQLALSFDIDLKEMFLNYIEETKNIYKSLPPDESIINDEAKNAIGQVVYQLSYTYQLQKLAKYKDLELDPNGILILSGLHYEATGKSLLTNINTQDAIRVYLRCVTPGLFSDVYSNSAAEAIAVYWLWVAITTSPYKEMKQHLSELPSYLNTVFLQMFLLKSFDQVNEIARMVNFTLLTRILCLMPEDITFAFIIDTLLTCPYAHAKLAILSILKDLMLKTCHCKDGITAQMDKLKLGDNSSKEVDSRNPPPPPPRPYISVNEHRMASIHSVALISIEASAHEKADKDELILMLSYVNFFIALKHKWDTNLLKIIHAEVNDHFGSKSDEVKEISFIKLSNETLGKGL